MSAKAAPATLPNSGMRLAMLLQAIDACDRGFASRA
jgi:hypothetical protein